jgi:hypothetical protein
LNVGFKIRFNALAVGDTLNLRDLHCLTFHAGKMFIYLVLAFQTSKVMRLTFNCSSFMPKLIASTVNKKMEGERVD